MAQQMQQRRDTAANWTSINPILAQGEVGVEIDANPIKFKIGNGTSAWNSLGYAGGVTGPGGPPSGAAGGVLSGSYPNPGFLADMATQTELNAAVAAIPETVRDTMGTALVGAGGIIITPSDGADTITIDGAAIAGYTDEQARDAIAAALVGTGGITITPNDVGNTITIDGAAAYTDEQARDALGTALLGTGGITVTPSDVGNTITIDGSNAGTQTGGFGMQVCLMTTDVTESAASFTDLTGMVFNVVGGHRYRATFYVPVRSAVATSGPQFMFAATTMTSVAINTRIPRLAASADGLYEVATFSMATTIAGIDLPTGGDDYLVEIVAVFQPSADGTVQLRGRAETSGQLMTFQSYGFGELIDYDDPLATSPSVAIPLFIRCSDTETQAATTGTNKGRLRAPFGFIVQEVRAALTNAGAVTVDINVDGVSMLSTKLTIDAAERTSETAAIPAVILEAEIADDAEITVDIDAVTGAPAGLKVWLIGVRDDNITVPPPPPETDLITESFDGVDGAAANTVTTNANSLAGSGVLTFTDAFSTDGSGGLRVAGTTLSALRWEFSSHTLHYAKWYYQHTVTPSSTAWLVYLYAADGTTLAVRVGINSSGFFIIQTGTAGATDATTVAAVVGRNYRFDLTVNTGPDTARLAIYTLGDINDTTEADALDVLQVTTTAADLSDELIGLNVAITGTGGAVPGNLMSELFNSVPLNNAPTVALTTASSMTGSGTLTGSNTWTAEGAMALNLFGDNNHFLIWNIASHTTHKASFYCRLTSAYTTNMWFYKVRDAANALDAFQAGIGTDNRLRIRNSNNGTAANAVTAFTLNQTYRVDLEATAGGAYTAKIYTGANVDSTTTPVETITMIGTVTAANFGNIGVGMLATIATGTSGQFKIDRVKADNTALPTPLNVTVGATPFDGILDRYRSDSAVMPANTFITPQGGSDPGTVSALLVPPPGKCWWGAMHPTRGSQTPTVAGMNVWMTFSRRRPDISHFYKTAINWNGIPNAEESNIMDPSPGVRTIGLFNWRFATGTNWQAIAGGSNDTNLRTWAANWADYPHKVFINLHHEFDRTAGAAPNSWVNYAAAFRHIVDVYRDEIPSAQRNLIFMWGPTGYSSSVGANGSLYNSAWPGDDYVDWIAWDPYFQTTNRQDFGDFVTPGGVPRSLINENVAGTAGWSGFYAWATTPKTVGQNSLAYPFGGAKPLCITEWGTWFATDAINGPDVTASPGDLTDQDGADRIRSIGDQAPDYPAIKAIVHYNDDPNHWNHIDPVTGTGAKTASADAFGDVGELAYFNTGVQNAP